MYLWFISKLIFIPILMGLYYGYGEIDSIGSVKENLKW